MADKLINSYKNCKEYADTIIEDISSFLKKNKIKYENHGSYEIKVTSKKSADDIRKILSKIDIPKDVLKILIEVYECNNTVFIRQKLKNE